jgi:uncharacterized protein YndB with AHSA1/START domain
MKAAVQTPPFDEKELTITRGFDAPRATVFRAWTDAEQLAQWWGPKDFTNTVCEIDPRVGGALRIHMRAPDGNIYPMKGVIREIVAPERIVFTSIAVDLAGKHLLEGLTTVTFADENGKTKLVVHTRMAVVAKEALVYLQGMEIGWTQSIDRLQAFVKRAG